MINAKEEMFELLAKGGKDYRTNMSVDNVIFGYHEKELKILLFRNIHYSPWMLPSGYIKKSEDVETAAVRVAWQRTGLDNLFLQQFKIFSSPDRTIDPLFTPEILSRLAGFSIDQNHWIFGPVISIGFYTLTEFSKVNLNVGYFSEEAKWWDLADLPPLLLDHQLIINEALESLRLNLYHYPIGYELLPEKFTLPEIRVLYETILGKQMDDRNFARKLMSLGIIVKLDELKQMHGHRLPYLYKFNKEIYQQALTEGIFIS